MVDIQEKPTNHYPDTGAWAVAARVVVVLTVLLIAYASLAPGRYVPRLLYSHHLQHFAAFYVFALAASAAFPRCPLRRLAIGCILIAMALEGGHVLAGRGLDRIYENCIADVGGTLGALVPIAVDRFRRMFKPVDG